MIKTTKKTKEELIAIYESKIKKLKQEGMTIDKDMPGVNELLAAFDYVVKESKISAADVIKGISRMKRTGLVFTKPVRKPKASKKTVEDKSE